MDKAMIVMSGCTPNYQLHVQYYPNPNGLPLLYLDIVNVDNLRDRVNVPLNKEAVEALTREFQRQLAQM